MIKIPTTIRNQTYCACLVHGHAEHVDVRRQVRPRVLPHGVVVRDEAAHVGHDVLGGNSNFRPKLWQNSGHNFEHTVRELNRSHMYDLFNLNLGPTKSTRKWALILAKRSNLKGNMHKLLKQTGGSKHWPENWPFFWPELSARNFLKSIELPPWVPGASVRYPMRQM